MDKTTETLARYVTSLRYEDLGLRAVDRPVHVHDLHATILWALGLDHVKVTYLHNGRSERPTIVSGEVVKEALA